MITPWALLGKKGVVKRVVCDGEGSLKNGGPMGAKGT